MPDFSLLGGANRFESVGPDTADSRGTDVTASGTINTKGSYVQLTAASGIDAQGIWVILTSGNNAANCLVDIAVGAAASEQDIVSNLMLPVKHNAGAGANIPIHVALGSRISARAQSSSVSDVINIAIQLMGNTLTSSSALGRCTTYGANTADSGGTEIDPGASANTKGAYVQIDGAISNPIKNMIVAVSPSGSNGQLTTAGWLIDVAVGAAASEQVVISNLFVMTNGVHDTINPPLLGPFPVNIPSGSRIAVRAQSDTIDATDRLFDVAIYGLD